MSRLHTVFINRNNHALIPPLPGRRLAGLVRVLAAFLIFSTLTPLLAGQVDTVGGASKHEQKVADAPANVTLITADDSKHFGWRTVGEALRSVGGLYVTYDRGYAYLGSRGINRPGAFWVVNTTLFARALVKNLEVSVSVYNLLNQHYRDPVSTDFTQAAIPQNGRTFRLNATRHF